MTAPRPRAEATGRGPAAAWSRALTGLRLAVRGVWFRRSTALIVLGLAVVASGASVVAPLYARAAEESVVRSTLQRSAAYELGMHLSHGQGDAATPPAREETATFGAALVRQDLTHPAFGTPQVAFSTRGRYRPPTGPNKGTPVIGRVVERAQLCAHLPVAAGRCATAPGEVLLSRRSLVILGSKVGDTITVQLPELTADHATAALRTATLKVVGSFDPVSVETPYWAGQPYFSEFYPTSLPEGLGVTPPVADPAFVGPGTAAANAITGYTLDVPVLTDRVRLTDAPLLAAQLRQLRSDVAGYGIAAFSNLPSAIAKADRGRELVRVAAPLAVTQLVLLSWWTLYLVVGSATEERSPELGLAKLRGLSRGQTSRFGLAEIVLLLVVAAPLGTILGYVAVRAAASRVFAPGTQVVLTGSVLGTVTLALAGAAVTVALAARRVFRRPVGDLLRRVPGRHRARGATVLEGAVVALAVAGVVQLVNDRGQRPSPIALLAPGMVAVVGGIVASRWLVGVARNRSAAALERGKAARLIGWSGVARRPGTARIAAVLAFATCLLLVGVEAWSVAARNRDERASAEVGAAVVLQVRAPGSLALLQAVRAADPDGRYAMAAVRVTTTNQQDSVLAVDGRSADRVMRWGSPADQPSRSIRSIVAPALPPTLVVHPGPLSVVGSVARVASQSPVTLTARLDAAGTPLLVPLGTLRPGRQTWTGTVPAACARGCRLAALSLAHPVTDLGDATVRMTVASMSAAGPGGDVRSLATGFPLPASWRPPAETAGSPTVRVLSGPQLSVQVAVTGGTDAEVVRGDAPEPQPAYAGSQVTRDPAETGAARLVTAGGLSGSDTSYLPVRSGPFVPRVGRAALLVDLDLALRNAPTAPEGDREVWLARDDPGAEKTLTRALAARGVRVQGRQAEATVERGYAGDGAVLALRLLLVCGAVAVLVAIGAMLVAAYVGRRQRAYEVAALRVVGLRRATLRAMLLRENVGTVLIALVCGAAAGLVASWVVLPSLPQFDLPSTIVSPRFTPDAGAGWVALAALAAVLAGVGLVVATLQLRAGRSDRLREGVR